MLYPIALGMPGGAEWIIIAAIGLLLFGKRLPEVGKSLGKGIVEFKKGLKGIEEEVEQASNTPSSQPTQQSRPAIEPEYKFDPYTGKPVQPEPAQLGYKFDPHTGQPLHQD